MHRAPSFSHFSMRLALLSDIHGNLAALEAVTKDLRSRGVDQVVNLGDSLSGPLLPLETAQFLMAQGWLNLASNHERQFLTQSVELMGPSDSYAFAHISKQEFDWLGSLLPCARLAPDVLLCHGSPQSDTEYFLETLVQSRDRFARRALCHCRTLLTRSWMVSFPAVRALRPHREGTTGQIARPLRLGARHAHRLHALWARQEITYILGSSALGALRCCKSLV